MEVIKYSEWIDQTERQTAQQIALLAAQRGVDGIVDLDNLASFPLVGVEGYLYLAKNTGKLYSWDATKGYVRVDAGSDYTLPVATNEVLGGVKIGSGLSISGGVLSANEYTLPTATDEVLGGVKVGSGLTITEGVLEVNFPDTNIVQNIQLITSDGETIDANTSVAIGTVEESVEPSLEDYSVNLPASSVGKVLKVKNMGTATMLLIPAGTDTIDDDDLGVGLVQYRNVVLLCYKAGKWCEL